jgi:FixJ family two-component response regulator
MHTRPTVFVVDADQQTRDTIGTLANTMNFDCRTYASGREFLEAYDDECPGCLILEIRIPDVNGLQVQEHLTAQGKAIPVVFLTGHQTLSIAVRAMRAGAVHFLEKPIRQHEVYDAIREAIEIDHRRREGRRDYERCREAMEALDLKEKKILQMLASGQSKQAIAAELEVSVRTVEMRRSRLMKKLDTKSLMELVHFAVIACDQNPVKVPAGPRTRAVGTRGEC